MKSIYTYFRTLSIAVCCICMGSCQKYLDAKQNKRLATPSSIEDLQALLDYNSFMNVAGSEASEIAADNYYIPDVLYSSLPSDLYKDAYLWKGNIFTPGTQDWSNLYNTAYYGNVVLDNIGAISRTATNGPAWDNCKGGGYFFRAKSFYEIAQIWTVGFDSTTADTDLGIPLRLVSDFNGVSTRSSLRQTYMQIIADLKEAAALLPVSAVHPYRPSRPAAYALLARTYLTVRNYAQAKIYADSSLQLRSGLLDYNNVPATPTYPFSTFTYANNPEDIMHTVCNQNFYNLLNTYNRVDSTLFRSYDANDLRRSLYFTVLADGSVNYRGSYRGSSLRYNGVAVDEVYLVRAECLARQGSTAAAMNDLNTLMQKRWKASAWIPFTASSAADALNKILTERRKELLYRMLRFTDIKRYNKEGAGINLKRVLAGQTYTLPANDPRFALSIPMDAVQLGGVQQNPGW